MATEIQNRQYHEFVPPSLQQLGVAVPSHATTPTTYNADRPHFSLHDTLRLSRTSLCTAWTFAGHPISPNDKVKAANMT